MPIVETRFGYIHAGPHVEYFASGALKSCIAVKASPLSTEHGTFVPQFTSNTFRKRQFPCITFHESGMLNLLPLEEQVVLATPLGKLPAEKIALYPDGTLKRLFPLDGCLSGFWGEDDERKLAHPSRVQTPVGPVEALLLTFYFSPKGNIKSLTLWPGEVLDVPTPLGAIPSRIGMAFHDSGALKSVEPERPAAIRTPIGDILAFDPDANGITADWNSLCFSESGDITSVTTVSTAFLIAEKNGSSVKIEPPLRVNPMDGVTREPGPLTVDFEGGHVRFSAKDMKDIRADIASVRAQRYVPLFTFSPTSDGAPRHAHGSQGMHTTFSNFQRM